MLKVELDIFSGMPNPLWDLLHGEKKQLIDRVMADRSLILPFNANTGGLGYRGFIVTADKEHSAEFKKLKLPRKFRLGGISAADSASWLLNTPGANQTTAGDVLQVAQDSRASPPARTAPAQSPDSGRAIDEPIDPPYEEPPSPPADYSSEGAAYTDDTAADTSVMSYGYPQQDVYSDPGTPPDTTKDGTETDATTSAYKATCRWYFTSDTDFSFWNNNYYSLNYNNCYNYASNHRTNTFAQPGRCSGRYPFTLDCGSMGVSLYYDRWYSSCVGKRQNYAICLVIWPGRDFHFYRWCVNNHWCHKPGRTAARNYDNSGYWITNPQYCNRGPYSIFCGYRYGSSLYWTDLCIN